MARRGSRRAAAEEDDEEDDWAAATEAFSGQGGRGGGGSGGGAVGGGGAAAAAAQRRDGPGRASPVDVRGAAGAGTAGGAGGAGPQARPASMVLKTGASTTSLARGPANEAPSPVPGLTLSASGAIGGSSRNLDSSAATAMAVTAATAAAASPLVADDGRAAARTAMPACPICRESFLTLAQLNQHLDDQHAQADNYDASKRSLFTWFEAARSYVMAPVADIARDLSQRVRCRKTCTGRGLALDLPNDCFRSCGAFFGGRSCARPSRRRTPSRPTRSPAPTGSPTRPRTSAATRPARSR